jgi:hypothetical protein
MQVGAVTLLDQRRQLSGIHIGILPLLLEGELEQLALEFYGTLAARLPRKEANKAEIAESLLNLIEAFPAEAELATRLRNRISVDGMGAQHLVFDLGARSDGSKKSILKSSDRTSSGCGFRVPEASKAFFLAGVVMR